MNKSVKHLKFQASVPLLQEHYSFAETRPISLKLQALLPLIFLLVLGACQPEENQPENQPPLISLVQPVDTFGPKDEIPVELVFSDD